MPAYGITPLQPAEGAVPVEDAMAAAYLVFLGAAGQEDADAALSVQGGVGPEIRLPHLPPGHT